MAVIPGKPLATPLPTPERGDSLESAIAALARGEPVLLFDDPGREAETDIVLLAEKATPQKIRLMREEAGGLLCVTMPLGLVSRVGLGYQHDLLEELGAKHAVLGKLIPKSLPYDRRSAFGIWVNSRDTFTGVTDRDRSATISAVGRFVRDSEGQKDGELTDRFSREFLVPGHVPLLHPSPGLLRERRGHTELSTALAQMGHLTPSLALMEMLGEDGGALPRREALERARSKGWAFVDGKELTQAWLRWSV